MAGRMMWPVRVLQVSDLHTGTLEEPEVEEDLRRLVAEADPELVVASGDLTHRNKPDQHARAAGFLRSLERPLLVIPGNHDIPVWPPARFTATFDAFRREWPETEPVYRSERIVACGLNSVRPWKHQGGALRRDQIEGVGRTFAESAAGALRLVALHHHLMGAPWRTRKLTIANRSTVLGGLVDAGADLIVSGHVHQSSVGERREFEVLTAASRLHATTVAIAPGLGQPRPKRRGEARGLHLYEADERSLRVLTYAWAPAVGHGLGSWVQIADRRFPRGEEPLATVG
ncbi:MAG: metallophosphoesterase [Actinobacteria bacterium]|nr:metallophosphoesterase [Actinomycetota bacterium]